MADNELIVSGPGNGEMVRPPRLGRLGDARLAASPARPR